MSKRTACLHFFCSFALSTTVFGWSITPTLVTLTQEKPQAFLTITPDKGEKAKSIEIYAVPRYIDDEGVETQGPRSKEFVIYPSQVILKEDEPRRIRVVWKNNKQRIDTEQAYRLIAASLPVAMPLDGKNRDGETIGVNIALGIQYTNSLYITPKGASASLSCTKTSIDRSNPEKPIVVIEVKNNGTAHQFLQNFAVSLQSGTQKILISKQDTSGIYGGGINILANRTRLLRLPLTTPLTDEKALSATLVLD